MADVLQLADLTYEGMLVELKLPLSSKRLDVHVMGSHPSTHRDHWRVAWGSEPVSHEAHDALLLTAPWLYT